MTKLRIIAFSLALMMYLGACSTESRYNVQSDGRCQRTYTNRILSVPVYWSHMSEIQAMCDAFGKKK